MTGAAAVRESAVDGALAALERRLLAARTPSGAWVGELSSSALATAVAIAALDLVDRDAHRAEVARGAFWLRRNANEDGGWGDCPASPSHLSTTVLAWAALRRVGCASQDLRRAEAWISRHTGSLAPAALARALAAAYGRDRTFSAPILAAASLAGVLGGAAEAWRLVPQLPFELALLPHRLLSWLRLPVVSYALPALIAIGLGRHAHRPSRWSFLRALRDAVRGRVLERLARIQPASGGFLEATPLTAFVALGLAGCGLQRSPVVERSVAFLVAGQRADGSWPIDTNLATWVTTLSVKALAAARDAERPDGTLRGDGTAAIRERPELRRWLLGQQHTRRHPFTGAAPGGFGWTDLPGGVPDADDTAGALVALHELDAAGDASRAAARRALHWLTALQNRDGGVPTFCRGWGRLPFDRSCPDVTAHAIRAVRLWLPQLPPADARRARRFVRRALGHLVQAQQPDGSWLPLWFGNPWRPDGSNAVYGTAQVLDALGGAGEWDRDTAARLERAAAWLLRARNADGGWGCDACGGSTMEETGLALAALAPRVAPAELAPAADWLVGRCADGAFEPAPIGLYFSSLRYCEQLYPVVFSLTGLARFRSACRRSERRPIADGRAA